MSAILTAVIVSMIGRGAGAAGWVSEPDIYQELALK